jgi:hypothetical protein
MVPVQSTVAPVVNVTDPVAPLGLTTPRSVDCAPYDVADGDAVTTKVVEVGSVTVKVGVEELANFSTSMVGE